jgi:hypothetical protein
MRKTLREYNFHAKFNTPNPLISLYSVSNSKQSMFPSVLERRSGLMDGGI